MLADEVLCKLSTLHDYSYTEGDANLYDPDEFGDVIELMKEGKNEEAEILYRMGCNQDEFKAWWANQL